ncbi:hypothetical protein, partial [Streptococcus suis]|uniref:hypothetical protein n=1 Tax=Streptococcus suis TaxID=1307 RepID=UPI000A61ACB8
LLMLLLHYNFTIFVVQKQRFLLQQCIVITKSSLLFYDGIELGLRAVQKREFLLERKVLRQNSYFCRARLTPSYLIKSDSLLLLIKRKEGLFYDQAMSLSLFSQSGKSRK